MHEFVHAEKPSGITYDTAHNVERLSRRDAPDVSWADILQAFHGDEAQAPYRVQSIPSLSSAVLSRPTATIQPRYETARARRFLPAAAASDYGPLTGMRSKPHPSERGGVNGLGSGRLTQPARRNAMDVRAMVEDPAEVGVCVHCLALGGADLMSAAGKRVRGEIAVGRQPVSKSVSGVQRVGKHYSHSRG